MCATSDFLVMAKFDEADPRWIVKERQDGTNVNGWHWEEKDLLPRFQTALNEQLLGHTLFDNDIGKISIKKIDACTGEFSGNQRKGKRFIVYEFEINLNSKQLSCRALPRAASTCSPAWTPSTGWAASR